MKRILTVKLLLITLTIGLLITAGTYFITHTISYDNNTVGMADSSVRHGYPLPYLDEINYIEGDVALHITKAHEMTWLNLLGDIVVWSGVSFVGVRLVLFVRKKSL